MRKADETSHFFFGSLNFSKNRNIFIAVIPIAFRGGFDKKKLPPQRQGAVIRIYIMPAKRKFFSIYPYS